MSFPRYPEYKGSGVEWLGNVPDHWEVVRVRWLCEIKKWIVGELGFDVLSITQRGIRIKDTESNDGQLSMDYSKYQLVEVGDFAMNHMDLLTGYVDISPVQGVTSPDYRVFSLRNPVRCHAKFFLYLFQNGYLNKVFYPFGQGSSQLGRWRLPTEQFNDFWFPVPSFEEQSAIATFLDRETAKIDALVAEQGKLIALLQEKRQAVISHAVTKGLHPNVPMKDSGVEWLGEVPGHWACIRLKQLVIESVAGPYGASLTKAMYAPDGYRVYGQQQAIADDFSVGDYFISEEKYEEMRRYTVFEGDVLVSVMGTIGKVAVVPPDAPPGIINPRLVRYRCGDLIQPRYLQSVLMCQKHQEHLVLESNGTTMDGLNMVTLGRVPIPTPPLDEQTQILRHLKDQGQKFDPLINEARIAITLLQERRTALISAAVTGQIDVRGLVGSANAPDSIAASAYPASA